jgi:multisubunit Na+/H+ antiporter MnhE subunit
VIGTLVRAAALTGTYLLVLTSLAPGDVLVGAALGLALSLALRSRTAPRRGDTPPVPTRLAAAVVTLVETAEEMVRGSWRTARFCLGRPSAPGFVEIPRGDRSATGVALWGLLTGEAPDEVVVDVEEHVLVVHLIDAGDPDAVRERHRRAHRRHLRKVAP